MKRHQLETVIRETMIRVGVTREVRLERNGINMTYHFIHDYITYDPDRIPEAVAEQEYPVSLKTYVAAITMHELGHALDRRALLAGLSLSREVYQMKKTTPSRILERNPEYRAKVILEEEQNLLAEKTAWENAEELNRKYRLVSEKDFEAIKRQSLSTYERRLAGKVKILRAAAGEDVGE
ncbi:hypothetical protein [Bhargavaea beijingensis]|uniref:Integrase n=1 Tax=Bhargavaea beijingensis TaxID=426756 RepID=A0A1G7AH39_9BACL|nr:hypothetical protein [Bhargavaea beijingensis]MCW1928127.1 integrase [Bhargavaea beijingensis]RSK24807.1 integrase [Bhargavaea beijingensis]SDE14119.1 hypothetical protein SAMN04488126_10413 [Bhargavaea beijingensis]